MKRDPDETVLFMPWYIAVILVGVIVIGLAWWMTLVGFVVPRFTW